MSITKQTCCPHCSSVFNITDEQLAARGGHVRCGGCLQVFRADQHLVTGAVVAQKPASESVAAQNTPVVARTQNAHTPSAEPKISEPKKRTNPNDESWAASLVDDDDNNDTDLEQSPKPIIKPSIPVKAPAAAVTAKKPMFDDEISDMLQDAWMDPISEKNHLKGVGEVDKIKESADESWAKALISELEEEEKKEQSKNYSMEVQPKKPKEPPRKAIFNKEPEDTPLNKASTSSPSPSAPKTKSSTKAETSSNKEDDLLNFLNSNSAPTINQRHANLPLEIHQRSMTSVNWGYWLTWTALSVSALVLLLAQYVYFHFNELSIAEKTRPQIVMLCNVLHCKPPEPPDISQIAVNKLVIRPHPTTVGALRVNAIVFNKASFAQPLPALKLTFMSRQSKVTAARVFQSTDYLQGDTGHLLRRIPPETPIHIQLDIVDPKVKMDRYKMIPLF